MIFELYEGVGVGVVFVNLEKIIITFFINDLKS